MNDDRRFCWKVIVDYGHDSQMAIYSEGPKAAVGTIEDHMRKFFTSIEDGRAVQQILLQRAPITEIQG